MIAQERVKVSQDPDACFLIFEYGAEQCQGIALGSIRALGGGAVDNARCGAPDIERLALILGERVQFLERTFFFRRDHPEQGIAGTYIDI
jgi:hypothetical protein